MVQAITEEDEIHQYWYVEAREMTPEKLPAFIEKLTTQYDHDYGTIVHAVTAAAVAAAWAMNSSKQGHITGFQAQCVMWGFIKEWMNYKDAPLRLTQYKYLLYPQYEKSFTTIAPGVHEYIRKEANRLLLEEPDSPVSADVVAHWRKLANGEVPFGLKVEGE